MAVTLDKGVVVDEPGRPKSCKDHVAWRYVVAACGFFALFNSYAMRSHLSVTLVAMVNTTTIVQNGSTTPCDPEPQEYSSTNNGGQFNWDAQMQGIVNSGFYWGYLLPQVFGGRMAEIYGSRKVVFVGGVIGTLGTFLGPWAATVNVGFFLFTRILCGLGLAVFTPSLHSLIAKWCHPSERSRLSSFIYSGQQFGVVISMPVSGFLCEYGSDGGWPWPFYVFGIIGVIWLVLWVVLVYNSPSEHPWISEEERSYIEDSLKDSLNKERPPIPWKQIFSTGAVWSLIFAHFGYNWGFYTLLTQLPTYMSNVLRFNLSKNGVLSSLPYIVMMVVGYTCSIVADMLIKRNVLTVQTTRKIFNTAALYGSGICLFIITFLSCQTMTIYGFLVMAVAFDGGIYAGFQINHVDLSPNFAGTLQGITNTAACIPGIVSPYITGAVTEGQETQDRWNIIFYITFSLLIVLGTQYWIFGKGTLQSWNNPVTTDKVAIGDGDNGGIGAVVVELDDGKGKGDATWTGDS